MDIRGESFIPVPRESVWRALYDAETLGACIPGCRSIACASDNEYDAVVETAVGPVKARFRVKILISDAQPPCSYVLNFNGQGAAAGIARGSARIELTEQEDGTRLSYESSVQLGGKLAQIGSRLVHSTVDRLSAQFFGAFSEKLGGTAVRPGSAE